MQDDANTLLEENEMRKKQQMFVWFPAFNLRNATQRTPTYFPYNWVQPLMRIVGCFLAQTETETWDPLWNTGTWVEKFG